jgi:hypothetical protein
MPVATIVLAAALVLSAGMAHGVSTASLRALKQSSVLVVCGILWIS